VYMVASIAGLEQRKVRTIDITGAYLNASMEREVFMRLDPKLAKILCEVGGSEYTDNLNPDGSLIVELKKALYGCVESAKLWYEDLSKCLMSLGFVKNEKDSCIFNVLVQGHQCTVSVYVDDLMCTCESDEVLEWLESKLRERYKEITSHQGDKHSYLGQTFDFSSPGKVKVTMEGYIADVLNLYEVEGFAATPATSSLFEVDAKSVALEGKDSEEFHSRVYKLLYLAKRVRPDLHTAITFLSTRIQCSTVEDWNKLIRVLKYLNATQHLGIVLEPTKGLHVLAYVDASFAVHEDFKSHTGGVITLGRGPIYVTSKKQKLNSKSSTESELIGISDVLPQVIWTRDFLLGQGYTIDAATLFQDNKSTIILANRGSSNSERTRHVAIRYFFIKDRIASGEICVEYLPTDQMLADILTKPLQGQLFRRLRKELLNME